jgi:hypothetical protein
LGFAGADQGNSEDELVQKPLLERTVTEHQRLKRELYWLGQTINANAQTLVSKTMTLDDREALSRQMAIRIAHQRLLQRRLDRLTPRRDEPPRYLR